MSTSGKRASARSAAFPAALINALLVTVALGFGCWLLVSRGQIAWPPHRLLAGLSTVAGCVALVGPLILARSDAAEAGLGTMLWWFGGVLIWLQNFADLARGEFHFGRAPSPIASPLLGLAVLAAMIAGWRTQGPSQSNSWTNILGWILGLFWIGLGVGSFVPGLVPPLAR